MWVKLLKSEKELKVQKNFTGENNDQLLKSASKVKHLTIEKKQLKLKTIIEKMRRKMNTFIESLEKSFKGPKNCKVEKIGKI